MKPPRLTNDCFVLPQGISWTPVDTALDMLRAKLVCVVAPQTIDIARADGRVAARDICAARANPPTANSAVDGYGFARNSFRDGIQIMPLVDGRSAAGQPFAGAVPPAHAVRILTGATLPRGVDTVVLQEDVTLETGRIAFHGSIKAGANTRAAGEDVSSGEIIALAGRRIVPQDIALMAATAVGKVSVFRPLRVGVLSTGDELRAAGDDATPDQIYDANGPMLASILGRWGHDVVTLGRAPDERTALRRHLDEAAGAVDAIVVSGGASAGDEDHMSALLSAEGQVHSWRIALKPGRPLALGQWRNVPLFGLPGNPVAAFVCALIFVRPALAVLSGANWPVPRGFDMPAAFKKSKKQGRREYLRARLTAGGQIEVFKSEGSGRISGLSWSDGLVELGDAGAEIVPGTPVRYIPYAEFGLA